MIYCEQTGPDSWAIQNISQNQLTSMKKLLGGEALNDYDRRQLHLIEKQINNPTPCKQESTSAGR